LRHAERTVAYFMPIAQLTCRAAIKPMSNNSLGPPEGVLNNLLTSLTVPITRISALPVIQRAARAAGDLDGRGGACGGAAGC
jgi:hypothetical protein